MTIELKQNIAGYYDEMGRFRPIRSPQYVGSGGSRRKATKADKRKYSKAKGGDLGKLRQERALEAPWDREYRLQQEEMAARDRERKRIEREIERDIAGDEGGRMSTGKARTLAQFVRGMGGINTQTRVKRGRVKYGDLENFTLKGSGSRGLVTTTPGKGLSLDYMHQAAREAGYDVTDLDDLLDRLDDEIRGNSPTYSTKGSMTYNPLPKYEYVYYATKIGDPDWKEVIAISGRPEKLTPDQLAKVKAAMKKDGYDRLRMAKIDLSTAPNFGGTVRRNPRKKNPDAISLFASLAGGVASALSIKQHLDQPAKKAAAKKRGTTRAKTTMRRSNPSDGRQIAATIREQLGGRKFEAMTGAKDFMFGPKYLQFRLPANVARSGINIVKISLTPADLYDVEYMKYSRLNFKTIAVSKGLMFDQLRSDFTAKTGLDTSLGSAGRQNPAAAAKRSKAPKGDLYVLTIGSGDDLISVYLHDGDKDGFSKRFKTLAAAKAFATRNKVKLVDNPAAKKVNGVISRAWARSRAKAEYARELRLAAAADRARSRRQKAEAKAKANPAAKYKIGDKVFSYFNPDSAGSIGQMTYDEYGKFWKYAVNHPTLGRRWINEKSLRKSKLKKAAKANPERCLRCRKMTSEGTFDINAGYCGPCFKLKMAKAAAFTSKAGSRRAKNPIRVKLHKFYVGQKLATRFIGDHDLILRGEVVSRTPKFVTVKVEGERELKRCGVYVFEDTECIRPLGLYSMAPIFMAKDGASKDNPTAKANPTIFFHGFGKDRNGNSIARFNVVPGRSFSIQTNGNLPKTHQLRGKKLNGNDLQTIRNEALAYIERYGTASQRKVLNPRSAKGNPRYRIRKNRGGSFEIVRSDGKLLARKTDGAFINQQTREQAESKIAKLLADADFRKGFAFIGKGGQAAYKAKRYAKANPKQKFKVGDRVFRPMTGEVYRVIAIFNDSLTPGKTRWGYELKGEKDGVQGFSLGGDITKFGMKTNPNSVPRRRTFEMFQGRKATTAKAMPVSRLAPARMDQLGDLVEIKLNSGKILDFANKNFKLCAAGGKLWIAGGKLAKANPAAKANAIDAIDAIDHVVYGTRKPHHGDHKYTHYIHRLGEESGLMPTLCVDREGFPIIRGGNYKIEARGIVD